MPLYDYDCAECGRRIEVIHGVHAPGPTHCPNCGGGPLKKAIAAPAVHFKGSGWAKKERHAAVASGASKASEPSSGGEGDTGSTDRTSKDTVAAEGPTSEGAVSDRAAPSAERGVDAGGRGSGDGRPGGSPKAAGAGAATKTD
jgi:putative FmdB family regulatory protein